MSGLTARGSRRKYNQTSYPSQAAVATLGASSSVNYNQAIECWSRLLLQATAENDREFRREEWNLLADACQGLAPDPTLPSPGEYLADLAEVAINLNGLGAKWLGDRPGRAAGLLAKLRTLDYAHAWALLWSVQNYWRYQEKIDHEKDEWWTAGFRRQLFHQAEKEDAT